MLRHKQPFSSPHAASPLVIAVFVLGAVLVAGCGRGAENDYTADSKSALLQACIEDDEDVNLVEVCVCVEEQIENSVPYSEFAEWEKRLAAGENFLPNRLAALIKGCIQTVSETR